MSLERIKNASQEVKDTQFAFIDDEIIELLSALAEHILTLGSEHEETTIQQGNLISPIEFEKRYKFIAANTLYRYCNYDEVFRKTCAIKNAGRWMINPDLAVDYLKRLPTFKKRLERLDTN